MVQTKTVIVDFLMKMGNQNNMPCNYHLLNEANDISLQIEINSVYVKHNKYNLLNNKYMYYFLFLRWSFNLDTKRLL